MTPAAKAKKVVSAAVVVGFPMLRAMAGVVRAGGCSFEEGLVFQSFAINWFKTEIAAGGHLCPHCGNLWSTRERRLACNHKGGWPSPETTATLEAWIEMAEGRVG